MMVVMLVVGIGLVLAGLLAIGFGILIELSTGNTLIITGVMGVCTGAIMFALWIAVRELRSIARRLGTGMPQAHGEAAVRPVLPPDAMREPAAPGDGDYSFTREPPTLQPGADRPVPPPPWQDEAVLRDHPIPEPMFPEDPPPPKPKRNLLFSSTSRKERERAQARGSEPLSPDMLSSSDIRPGPLALPPPPERVEPQTPSFEDAWPRAERAKQSEVPSQRRSSRTPSTFEANGASARHQDQPAVTVLKSGIVDGMAYSLYSDGSIEAQMPEGMMRFASIDELRAHLDQRH